MERPCCDKRRTFNRLEDAWAVVWGGEGGTEPQFPKERETLRSGAGWRVRDAVTSGRSPLATSALDTLTPVCVCGGVRTPATCSLPCTAAAVSTGERERERERELSSGYLIARVNKFTHTFFLVQCCESLILFLYAEREKIYDVYFKISSRLYYS